ncbi:MAG: site-2 protease family protein [Myxococcota bacterium]
MVLFRVAGMDVRGDAGAVVLAALVTWSLAAAVLPLTAPGLGPGAYVALAVTGTVGLLASILAHEVAQARVGRRFGVDVRRVTFWVFGGVPESATEVDRPRTDLWMAAAGIVCNLALSAVCFVALALVAPFDAPRWLGATLDYLGWANLGMVLVNLLPAFPLDGGRIVRALHWKASEDFAGATEFAARVGEGFGLALVALGIGVMLGDVLLGGLWWVSVGTFLRWAARDGRREVAVRGLLARAPVFRIMDRYPDVVVPGMTLDRFMDEHVYARGRVLFPVVEDGGLVGCADAREARLIPRGTWARRTVLDITRDIPADACIGPDASAAAALRQMEVTGWPTLLVTDEGRLEGIVNADDIGRYLAVRAQMEGPSPRTAPA